MTVIATCGHTLTKEEALGTTIAVKDRDKKGRHCVSYPTVCNKCLEWYKKKRLILTEKAQKKWLNT
jgi:hypothetical protein